MKHTTESQIETRLAAVTALLLAAAFVYMTVADRFTLLSVATALSATALITFAVKLIRR